MSQSKQALNEQTEILYLHLYSLQQMVLHIAIYTVPKKLTWKSVEMKEREESLLLKYHYHALCIHLYHTCKVEDIE